jgi:hypothetical protein
MSIDKQKRISSHPDKPSKETGEYNFPKTKDGVGCPESDYFQDV